jgi:hypothetical protein
MNKPLIAPCPWPDCPCAQAYQDLEGRLDAWDRRQAVIKTASETVSTEARLAHQRTLDVLLCDAEIMFRCISKYANKRNRAVALLSLTRPFWNKAIPEACARLEIAEEEQGLVVAIPTYLRQWRQS